MVIWSKPAKKDLRQIFEYIARDSRFYAKKAVNNIVEKSMTLDSSPRRGRIVPEINDPDIREIFIYSYRLMYHITRIIFIFLVLFTVKETLHPMISCEINYLIATRTSRNQ
jgi:addiction module RelE/StbE family toxin